MRFLQERPFWQIALLVLIVATAVSLLRSGVGASGGTQVATLAAETDSSIAASTAESPPASEAGEAPAPAAATEVSGDAEAASAEVAATAIEASPAPVGETAAVAAAAVPEEPVVSAPVIAAPPPEVGAVSYAILDRSCGALIWGKYEHERLAPASLTKIITALVVRDRLSLDEMTVSEVSAKRMRGSSVMGVEPGMNLSVRDLLYGLLLRSGNDAALVLAEAAGGSVDEFVRMMNQKVAQLGLADSQFANPHGLDDVGLYSSAYDMAQAGRVYLDDPVLAEISATPEYQPDWDGPALRNGNKLLTRYPGAYGVKNGYTENARQTFVAAANRDGRDLIVSVFGSKDRYADAALLFDWAFANTSGGCPAR